MPDLTKLIEKLEAVKEGSRELDREVAFAVGWTTSDTGTYRWICPHGRREIDAPGFTWSLDAALTLYRTKPERIPARALSACVEALQQWL